jgi:hypothetical protein
MTSIGSSNVHDGLHIDAYAGYWGLGVLGGMAPGLWASRRLLAPPRKNSC